MTMFRAQAIAGNLQFGSDFNCARFKEWLKEHEGAWLRISHDVPVRSMSQHRFYWLYLGMISVETGNTPEELHAWAKAAFLPPKYATVFGKEVLLDSTTTTLSKVEFGDYMEKICAESGVALPDPKEAGYLPN